MKLKRAKHKPRLSFDAQYAVATRALPSPAQLRRWARAGLERDAKVTVRVVGQVEGRTLNRDFRGRDYATNVLTFVYRDAPPIEGDLALCAPVVAREAREQGKNIAAHYAHLVVHGMLHLQGYDHENAANARIMEKRESQIVAGLGYADPYAMRGEE